MEQNGTDAEYRNLFRKGKESSKKIPTTNRENFANDGSYGNPVGSSAPKSNSKYYEITKFKEYTNHINNLHICLDRFYHQSIRLVASPEKRFRGFCMRRKRRNAWLKRNKLQ